jgi:diguanylate cyclase (GGDEF)-like protein/PAS domain S-box-containing protein
MTVLTGGNLPDVDMSELRARQIAAVRQTSSLQFAAIITAAIMNSAIGLSVAPIWLVAVYACAVILTVFARYMLRESRSTGWIHKEPGFVTREFAFGSIAGIVLALPMIWYAVHGNALAALQTWIVLSALLTLHAYWTVTVPLLFSAYFPAPCLIAVLTLAWLGMPMAGASAAIVTLVALCAMLVQARTQLRYNLLARQVDEHGKTVSLLLREFEDAGADWLWQIDTQRRITAPSPRFAHAFGRDVEELGGNSFLQLLAGEQWETGKFPQALHELANRLNRKESFANLLVPISRDGHQRWWELSASPTYDAGGMFTGFRGVGSDVTEQRASADRIAHLARFDGLTGLPNRLFINETLGGALEQATAWRRRCAFLMMDLDRFKAVNDTLGHPVGDRLLAQVASRLTQLCSDSDNIIAGRLGGDEFAVVIREIESIDAIEALGRRIIEVVSRPYEIDQHTLYVGASLGYAIGPRDGATVEALTRNADLALYRSKDRGGGTIANFEPTLHDQARERREIEIELRSALAKDEFEVHFQPVVRNDGSVDGFEALLRWNNKKLGAVSPLKFIPVAEDTRLIGPIGEWVLQTACREAARWPSTTKVAVNVSAEQLASPGFVSAVVKALAHSGIAPSRLELEVTESVFLREIAGAMATLDQVRALGVRLVLDDFGTGYSSLGYLRMGQFSTIKVDRSFVKGALNGNRESIAIIRAVVALADALEMSTTAEGVETGSEASAIIALGCRKLQGYYFGRPMPAEDALNIFSRPAKQGDAAA